jgi:predicted dehydrogenase
MNGLIVGVGSIGLRHLANLRVVCPEASVTVWHQRRSPGEKPSLTGQADRTVYGIDEALAGGPEFALITGPASVHVPTASALAARGVHLFVEKPLSNCMEGVDDLLGLCRRQGVALVLGYNFRFHEPLRVMRQAILDGRIGRVLSVRAEVGQYLPDWRPGSDYRRGVSARSELGGGAVLELSHEIDYVRWLAGEVRQVSAVVGHVSDLEIDVEDVAEITLVFEGGAIGSVHLDMIQRTPARTCRVIGSAGTLAWDGMTNELRSYSSTTGCWTELCRATDRDRNDMYLAELRHFLDCVRGSATSSVTGEDGRRVLQIALAAQQSSAEGRVVTV